MCDPSLFHDTVCGVARFDALIYRELFPGDRTVPNFMIAFALAIETATSFL